ncbi:hypothetical protein GX563_08780 [Candidatus Bathyarchaeota archaeon]|nr:hypothetical protein [Candidatus Bathyarchaeota archaeon]
MSGKLKKAISKRAIVIVLAILLVLTGINTYLILDGIQGSYGTNAVDYDFVLTQNSGYKLKNMLTGYVSDQAKDASTALNTALSEGNSVYLNSGTYDLTSDVYVSNKMNAKIVGDSATINGNGHKIVIYGDNYTISQYASISGLTLINGTIRVENSLGTTITNSKFIDSTVALEFANTDTWSEFNKVENCQFINNTQGIVFRSPLNKNPAVSNATGSYASSQIERTTFNIRDNSVGIVVEEAAQFSDSQLQNVRFWMGENEHTNQTAIYVDGAMDQTLLFGVVFESFTSTPNDIYAIDIGPNCDPAPTIDSGVSFLGEWTARIHNPYGEHLRSTSSTFKREVTVPVGLNGQFGELKTIDVHPLTIGSFTPTITVSGSFSHNETVTVRIRVEYIDNVISAPVTRVFNGGGTVALSTDELLTLFPSQSIIWSVLIDAKTDASSTDAAVAVSGYGTTA